MSALVSVGRVSKLFGLSGEVVINLYDTFPTDINLKESLMVKIDSLAVPLFFEKFERRGRAGAVVMFADIDNEVRASELVGLELFRSQSPVKELPKDDDLLYFEDLIGYSALFESAIKGTIEDFIDSEHNPLFLILIGDKEALIPANEEFIEHINEKKREIYFTLPNGLLDLYL